ncbi:MBL fold metallo-hydrolase [Polaribacter haliotis]|uniref:MBL fold metallo-hydrolase n=1 Tax=Polaribacter haliotis TaxID=1888915 RepID=A0A7L8AEY4_9FLAO|nr:MBL fold metallo-hydrolase [Polaribacter haliotis]QOD60565.1 MBL fold metallo-hydrolase [Polaribacter haliotis]
MKKIFFTSFLLILFVSTSCKNKKESKNNNDSIAVSEKETNSSAEITPISHATAIISFNEETIYLDPTGGKEAFADFKKPTYTLITDIHGDHMNLKTLEGLDLTTTKIIAPKAVAEKLKDIKAKEIIVINNGEEKSFDNFKIEAIPMYNLREEALKFHSKGRGNGYVLTINNERIYFSGDTEDIPEMRNLKNIDKAFVCMNLPYTMTVESAADAVLAFKPKQVFPYHYRGTEGLSDVEKFKEIVNEKDNSIEVVQWNWYPNRK